MSLQKLDILLLKRFSAMMRLLVVNVVSHPCQMRMRNGESAEPLLLGKSAADPFPLVDVIS